jgi:hypothetical protein
MTGVTLLIAIAASTLIIFLPPVYGLLVYVATFAYYPTYLSVQLGTIDFTARRIAILAIYTKLFLQSDLPGRFKFIWLDKLVIIYFAAQLLAGATTAASVSALLENRAGAAFDMVLPYFAVRMIVRNRQEYLTLLKGLLVLAAPLAVIGLYQCITGHNPAGVFMKYHAFIASIQSHGYVPLARKGLFRASVTFDVSIMFGLFFSMLGPVCAGVLASIKKRHKTLCIVGLALMAIGAFSSMSSGPWLAVFLAGSFIAFYRYRRHWKIAVVSIIVLCGSVEIISNRHFYEVIDRVTLSSSTAWYRARLIQVALSEGGMSGHWVTGYGWGVDPGWSAKIDNRNHTDVVNEYLYVLCNYGLIGLVPFLAINIAVIKRLVEAYRSTTSGSDTWLVWCLAAGLFGLWGAFMSVSIYGPPTTVYFLMVGFAGTMPGIMKLGRSKSYVSIREHAGSSAQRGAAERQSALTSEVYHYGG